MSEFHFWSQHISETSASSELNMISVFYNHMADIIRVQTGRVSYSRWGVVYTGCTHETVISSVGPQLLVKKGECAHRTS